MGRFQLLVKNLALIELFKEKYHIPQEVSIRYCSPEGLAFDREVGEVTILIIAFIEGGMPIYTKATNKHGQGFTLNLDLMLSSSSRVSPNLTKG